MITDIEQAHAALADALWWLRGFAAATPENKVPADLAEGLREVRAWLNQMAEGKVRRIGDEQAIVLTYAEFERIFDAIGGRGGIDADSFPGALDAVRRALEEYRTEAAKTRSTASIPF